MAMIVLCLIQTSHAQLVRAKLTIQPLLSITVSDKYLFARGMAQVSPVILQYRLCDLQFIKSFAGHTNIIETVLTRGAFLYSCSIDRSAKKWDIDSGNVTMNYPHVQGVHSVAIIGPYFLTGGYEGKIRIWNESSGEVIRVINSGFVVNSILVDGISVFCAGEGSFRVIQYNFLTGGLIKQFGSGHNQDIYSLFVSGNFIYSGSKDATARSWNITSGKQIGAFNASKS